jgi:hypothetical protein
MSFLKFRISLIIFLIHFSDEKLLEESLKLNDKLQSLLAKHDAIASGSAPPSPEEKEGPPPVPVTVASTSQVTNLAAVEDEEEEDDEFAQLARRYTSTTLLVKLI